MPARDATNWLRPAASVVARDRQRGLIRPWRTPGHSRLRLSVSFPVSKMYRLAKLGRVADRAPTAPKNEIPVSRSYACRRWSEDVGIKIRSRLPSPLRQGTKTADEPHAP
jgi:hypothetical protein